MSDCIVIRDLYDKLGEVEDMRLVRHPLEHALTLDAIERHIFGNKQGSQPALASQTPGNESSTAPSAVSSAPFHGIKIADIGGATGTYAFALADKGAEVHLRDLSTGLLAIAAAKQEKRCRESKVNGDNFNQLASIKVGNALDPESLFPASQMGTFDVVLLLGPLYHLIEVEERQRVLMNALSFLRPDGLLFAAFVSRNAHIRDIAVRDPERLVREEEFYRKYMKTGKYVRRGDRNAESYHANLSEIQPLIESVNAKVLEILGVEGILGGGLDKALAGVDSRSLQSWVDVMRDLGKRPENLGNADHWLVVIRRDL